MAHTALFEHIKLRRLMAKTGLKRPAAIGHLECLYYYVAGHQANGDISRLTDEEIEMAAEWEGEPGALLAAMIECRLIDREENGDGQVHTRIHDWLDWCPEYVKKRVRRAEDRQKRAADPGDRQPPDPAGRQTTDAEIRRTADNGKHRPPPDADGCPQGRTGKDREGKEDSDTEIDSPGRKATTASVAFPPSKALGRPDRKDSGYATDAAAAWDDRTRQQDNARTQIERADQYLATRLPAGFDHLPRIIKAAEILEAMGITDSGYRSAVGRKVQKDEFAWRAFIRITVKAINGRDRIDEPAAWIRAALRKEGVRI